MDRSCQRNGGYGPERVSWSGGEHAPTPAVLSGPLTPLHSAQSFVSCHTGTATHSIATATETLQLGKWFMGLTWPTHTLMTCT